MTLDWKSNPEDVMPVPGPVAVAHLTARALIEQAEAAFLRDFSTLLAEHAGEWVAYHGPQQIGFGRTRSAVCS